MSGMVYIRPFGQVASTVTLAVSTTTGNAAVGRPGMGTQTVRIVNAGTGLAFVEFGKSNAVVAAVATSMPILAGSVETFLLPNDITHIAAITGTGTATLYLTTGESA